MDFNPIATPIRLATGEPYVHACNHHTLQSVVVHA